MASAEQYAEWIVNNEGKKGSPEFETVAQAYKLARSEPKRALGDMADLVPRQDSNAPQGPPIAQRTGAGGLTNFAAPLEVALTLGSGALSGVVAPAAGLLRSVTGGKLGSQEGVQQGMDAIRAVQESMTYRPRGELAQGVVGGIGRALEASKLAGIGPAEAISLAGMAGPAARKLADITPNAPVPNMVSGFTPEPQMRGMGAAETSIPRMRVERAEALPVPMQLTKGQATRTFADQQFEREAAKNPTIGEPLRQRFAQQNEQIPRNLEFFADETGAQAGSIRATGQVVTEAIAEKANKKWGQVNAAYTTAKEKGAMQDPVNVAPVLDYLESKRSQFRNAGVLESTLDDISERAAKTGGVVTINDLEDVRQSVGAAGGKDATNAHYAKEIKKQIDALTENAGGPEYKYARRMREQYAKEFEDIGVIDRLLSYKPGTKDRSIALEDVFDKSIMGGTLDDVRAIRRTLQTGGPKGEQAWKELQGATVNNIKEQITKNSQRDINGNPVVSPAEFNKIVTGLDKDGKLYFIFGKQGAQKIRDLRDIALDSMTSPPGAVNTSNTASIILAAMDTIMSGTTGMPLPIGTATKYVVGKVKDNRLQKRVNQSLNPGGMPAS